MSEPNDCPRCHHKWQIWEEQCPECGFDPVNNEEDAQEWDHYRQEKSE